MDSFSEEIRRYNQAMVQNKQNCRLSDQARLEVIRYMDMVYTRESILFCIDLEEWEHDTSRITEVGVSIYDPRGQHLAIVPNIQTFHFMVAENSHLKNGKYVPDHSSNFSGQVSYLLPQKSVCTEVTKLINRFFLEKDCPCVLVGHNIKGDIKGLNKIHIKFPCGTMVLDTQTLYSWSYGISGASLKNALVTINQPFAFLHNAGNDAYYTLLLALKLCDPSVRSLLNFDTIPTGEFPGIRRKYPPVLTNMSRVVHEKPEVAINTSHHLSAQ